MKVDSQASVADKPAEHPKSKKPVKTLKKVKGKRGRKPKVSRNKTVNSINVHFVKNEAVELLHIAVFTTAKNDGSSRSVTEHRK